MAGLVPNAVEPRNSFTRYGAMDRYITDGETPDAHSLSELKAEADHCRRCDLYKYATQTVFGEGPSRAKIVLVGEQPGDKEDLAGRPFVGPAGLVLDECLEEAAVDQDQCYVTNAVKHFKFEQRGKRRLHAKPNGGEIEACSWWLRNELRLIHPKIVVALGGTAASALLGSSVRVMRDRGKVVETTMFPPVLVTIHPSYILRIRDRADAAAEKKAFIKDLSAIKALAT
ncbi:DNA polymerase [Phyllobacterium sp. CL33Tsu]|uniref:UdgX family uracil-DNA binding protein n=1 Tax=Phyllobacterium sp. CL33Tsu TaxID=1798191 RepID=UPI0008E7E4CD|nr:UdgX family uracil-DNA binding protein [Phyllobacterium sp. CL33Tsu]SFI80158.1 DNA polymerase [Phyllobacterium sp. CL33Tsu]